MNNSATIFKDFFDADIDPAQLPPYYCLRAKAPEVAMAAMDSSDQAVVTFDAFTGVAACRSGITMVDASQEVTARNIGEIMWVPAHPHGSTEQQLRTKLSLEQFVRLATGKRRHYASLRSGAPLLPPRLIAAGIRVVEDWRRLQVFANSAYAVPGMLLLVDGRLNAQNFPGAKAVDDQARLLRARGIRYVGIAKEGMLASVVRPEARAIRKRVGNRPFFFSVLDRHLHQAYRAGQNSAAPKVIRHGSSTMALGGVGAIRFALSLAGDHLSIVEMSLYDFNAFSGLVRSGESLDSHMARRLGCSMNTAFYSWHILPLVQMCDWERHIIPTMEEIVFGAYTDTELGIYPRALADVHNHIKLRFDEPELETKRRQIIVELAAAGIPPEMVQIVPEGPHKLDPEEYNLQLLD